MTAHEKLLRDRLAAWEREKESNQYGMAHLAERAIAELDLLLADHGYGAAT